MVVSFINENIPVIFQLKQQESGDRNSRESQASVLNKYFADAKAGFGSGQAVTGDRDEATGRDAAG